MNTRAKRFVGLLLAPLLGTCLLAGCGDDRRADEARTNDESLRKKRARDVAEAWEGSSAAAAWSRGYYLMADAVQAPESGWLTDADARAYETRNFVLRGELPTTSAVHGTVRWKDGSTLSRPLARSEEAYRSFALNDSEGPGLTVTGARLGRMTIATSRGAATVPAWWFTLEGYDTPLKRVAVTPSPLPEPPIGQARQEYDGGLMSVVRLVAVSADSRSITVKATHGACDDGPVVEAMETDGSVVVRASVAGERSGPCSAEMIEQNVEVVLRRPLGDRLLLDAFTGRPVPYGDPEGPSPTWT